MKIFTRLWTFMLYGGTRRLRDYEIKIINAVKMSMTKEDSETISIQIENLEHLKRLHDDRMVTFYFHGAERLPRLKNAGQEQKISKLTIEGNNKKINVVVVSHRGLMSSLEFNRSPTVLLGGGVSISAAKNRNVDDYNLASEIDAKEHR